MARVYLQCFYFADIDECKRKKCDQGCVNTPGSYTCFCNQGYALDYDEKTCIRMFAHVFTILFALHKSQTPPP